MPTETPQAAPLAAPLAAHVLVVEDEEPIRRMLVTTLEAAGYRVSEARTAREGETLAGNRRIDLCLIDLGLPDGDGIELIRRLRAWTQRPLIVLSARSQESQKVLALDAGADDFVAKPFGVAELHARIRVALRHAARTTQQGHSRLRMGETMIDLQRRQLLRMAAEGWSPVRLSATQWRLLEVLAQHAGRLVTGPALMREVWGPALSDQGHYLRIYVRQLRLKIEPQPSQPRYLLTEAGIGYRLEAQPCEDDSV